MKEHVIVGIDLGGTFIKGGVVDENGNILFRQKVPTPATREPDAVCQAIGALINDLCEKITIDRQDIIGVGVACPGTIDKDAGSVISSSNLHWHNVPFVEMLSKFCSFPINIVNDAVGALIGEIKFGAGKGERDLVMITLGTGVGTGVWKDGHVLENVEIGHMVIDPTGEVCACGRRGCFETYSSATALVRETKRAIEKEDTQMKQDEFVTGETVFKYYKKDKIAKRVLEEYLQRLVCGVANVADIFRPKTIILGGGICTSLQPFLAKVEEDINKETAFPIRLLIAKNGNDAGVLGAVALYGEI